MKSIVSIYSLTCTINSSVWVRYMELVFPSWFHYRQGLTRKRRGWHFQFSSTVFSGVCCELPLDFIVITPLPALTESLQVNAHYFAFLTKFAHVWQTGGHRYCDIYSGYWYCRTKLTSLHSLVPTACKYNTTTGREIGGEGVEGEARGKEERKKKLLSDSF